MGRMGATMTPGAGRQGASKQGPGKQALGKQLSVKRRHGRIGTMLRGAMVPALVVAVMAFFGGYAVLGPNGALAYGDYKRQLARRQIEFPALDKRRAELRNRVALLDPRHANPDMVDELARKKLNVVNPDEVIVPLH